MRKGRNGLHKLHTRPTPKMYLQVYICRTTQFLTIALVCCASVIRPSVTFPRLPILRYEAVDLKAPEDSLRDLPDSVAKHVLVVDSFLEEQTASQLRGVFSDRFADPRNGKPDRFVWDWWHIPNQYTLVRNRTNKYALTCVRFLWLGRYEQRRTWRH